MLEINNPSRHVAPALLSPRSPAAQRSLKRRDKRAIINYETINFFYDVLYVIIFHVMTPGPAAINNEPERFIMQVIYLRPRFPHLRPLGWGRD